MPQRKEKVCRACMRPLPLARFSRDHNSRDGLVFRCKDCERQRVADYDRRHPKARPVEPPEGRYGTLLSVAEVARRFPGKRPGDHASVTTVWRWIEMGIKARSGQRVRLAAVRLGHAWYVGPKAIDAFVTALSRRE